MPPIVGPRHAGKLSGSTHIRSGLRSTYCRAAGPARAGTGTPGPPQDRRKPSAPAQDSHRQLSYRCTTLVVMAVRKKRSISMPPDLDAEIAAAAAHAGMSYSAWLVATARKEFTVRAGLAAVSQFERDHGAFTAEELAAAEEWAATAVKRTGRTGGGTRRRSA